MSMTKRIIEKARNDEPLSDSEKVFLHISLDKDDYMHSITNQREAFIYFNEDGTPLAVYDHQWDDGSLKRYVEAI